MSYSTVQKIMTNITHELPYNTHNYIMLLQMLHNLLVKLSALLHPPSLAGAILGLQGLNHFVHTVSGWSWASPCSLLTTPPSHTSPDLQHPQVSLGFSVSSSAIAGPSATCTLSESVFGQCCTLFNATRMAEFFGLFTDLSSPPLGWDTQFEFLHN